MFIPLAKRAANDAHAAESWKSPHQSLDLCIRIIGGGKDGALDVRASRMVIDRSQRDPSDAKALRDGGDAMRRFVVGLLNPSSHNCPYLREAKAGAVEAGQA